MADGLLALEDARAAVLSAAARIDETVSMPPADALGRVLAADVVAAADLPPWDNSAMDGYAVLAADVAGATESEPVRLGIAGEVAAGRAPEQAVEAGRAIRIATGAPVPPGTTAVVPVEDTTPIAPDGTAGMRGRDASGPLPAAVLVHVAAGPGANIRAQASDIAAGMRVLRAGDAIGPAEVALAAAANAATIVVRRRPRVAVVTTGDELRAAGSTLGGAGIPDSNGPALLALARAAGAEARHLGIAPDRLRPLVSRLRRALAWADVVIVSGGVSVGPYDVVKPAFETIGRVDLWRVAIQPGKPFAFGLAPRQAKAGASAPGGRSAPAAAGAALGAGAFGAAAFDPAEVAAVHPARDAASDAAFGAAALDPAETAAVHSAAADPAAGPPVLLFGLPGNPVSSFVTFDLFVRPALRKMAGHRDDALLRPVDRAVLEDDVSTSAGRRTFVRVVAVRDAHGSPERDGAGRVRVRLAGGQGSHVISALAAADGLAVVPESVGDQAAGAPVELWWLDQP